MTDVDAMREILGRRRPELLPVVSRLEAGAADDEEVDEVQSVLIDELLEFGFESEDDTNEYGDQVERLIDLANFARSAFRDS